MVRLLTKVEVRHQRVLCEMNREVTEEYHPSRCCPVCGNGIRNHVYQRDGYHEAPGERDHHVEIARAPYTSPRHERSADNVCERGADRRNKRGDAHGVRVRDSRSAAATSAVVSTVAGERSQG